MHHSLVTHGLKVKAQSNLGGMFNSSSGYLHSQWEVLAFSRICRYASFEDATLRCFSQQLVPFLLTFPELLEGIYAF